MPVQVTPLLRGLLFSALLSAPMTALADQSPASEMPAQPLPAATAWDCSAQEGAQDCPPTKVQVHLRTTASDGITVDPADTEYRQAYPDGYARLPGVSAQQRQAQQLWLQRSRKASHPEGIGEPQSLFAAAPFAFLDWYPNPTGISPLSHCGGSYIQPEFGFKDSGLAADEQPVYIDADYSRTQNSKITELSGDVYLRKGDRQARSQQARVDHRSETAEMSGLVQFREPDMLLLGDRASVDMGTNEAVIEQAQFVVHSAHLRGSAETINRSQNGDLIITQGAYTRCPPGDNSWSIQGSNLTLSQESGMGEVNHATLRINEVPVFYVPYIYFPIDGRRLSGLLAPSFSLTTDNGFDLAQPYYFNLAPDYDDTLTFRHIGERGEMLENQFRYLNDYGQFDLGLAYLPDDDLKDAEDRWILGVDHSGNFSDNWFTLIDYTRVSDGDYFEDLGTDLNLSEQSHLDQRVSLNYRSSDFNFEALVQDFQTIDDTADTPYRKLPSLKVTGTPALENNWLLVDYLSSLISFDRDTTDFTGTEQITGNRLHLETTLMMPLDRSWGYIHPSLKLTHTQYNLDNTTSDDTPSRTLPLLSFDTGLLFDRVFDYEDQAYTQTLEPRLFYLDVPYQDQSELPEFDSSELTFGFNQLFRDNRFSGLDRIGDTRQVTAGLSTRLLDNQGYERGNASIGQIYYFKDRNVRLSSADAALTESSSNIVAEGVWNITKTLWVSADAEWDRNASTNEARNLKLAYRTDADHILNFRYRFTREELEQTDLTLIWPLSTQWSMLGRWQQDLRGKEALDLVAGVEFENCCWQVRTVYRQWITDDDDLRKKEGLFLQLVLKGLGGSGARAAGDSGPLAKSFLKDITGFEEHSNDE